MDSPTTPSTPSEDSRYPSRYWKDNGDGTLTLTAQLTYTNEKLQTCIVPPGTTRSREDAIAIEKTAVASLKKRREVYGEGGP